MPGHEFHSKFLSRNDKADKFRASVGGKLDGLIGDRVGEIVSGMQRNTRTTAEFCGVVYIVKPDGRVLAIKTGTDEDIATAYVPKEVFETAGLVLLRMFVCGQGGSMTLDAVLMETVDPAALVREREDTIWTGGKGRWMK